MQITVADVQRISVKPGETLVVFIDIAGLPRVKAETLMQETAKFMRAAITDPGVGVIVVPQGKYSFGVIDPTVGQPMPANQSIGGTAAPSQDAFDRAMKGLT